MGGSQSRAQREAALRPFTREEQKYLEELYDKLSLNGTPPPPAAAAAASSYYIHHHPHHLTPASSASSKTVPQSFSSSSSSTVSIDTFSVSAQRILIERGDEHEII